MSFTICVALSMINGMLLYQILTLSGLPVDDVTLGFVLINFSVAGAIGILYGKVGARSGRRIFLDWPKNNLSSLHPSTLVLLNGRRNITHETRQLPLYACSEDLHACVRECRPSWCNYTSSTSASASPTSSVFSLRFAWNHLFYFSCQRGYFYIFWWSSALVAAHSLRAYRRMAICVCSFIR